MVTIDYESGVYVVTVKLPRTPLNKELLKQMFGLVTDVKGDVVSIKKSKDLVPLLHVISNFMNVINLLKL